MKLWEDPTVVREAAVAAIQLYASASTNKAMPRSLARNYFDKLSTLIIKLIINARDVVTKQG